ncbi:hypothetical protein B0I35DRAFT_480931 [Stachybotrys elegans]|uniref:Uncharacterized protein n=1 Tax=Stachybotrys elegans TaxID=80388 RepID=A0A8K0SNC6_9HYPO|nr:hypothetical protein B0I35DRAFT_480931 [Stachybotrys elegans]
MEASVEQVIDKLQREREDFEKKFPGPNSHKDTKRRNCFGWYDAVCRLIGRKLEDAEDWWFATEGTVKAHLKDDTQNKEECSEKHTAAWADDMASGALCDWAQLPYFDESDESDGLWPKHHQTAPPTESLTKAKWNDTWYADDFDNTSGVKDPAPGLTGWNTVPPCSTIAPRESLEPVDTMKFGSFVTGEAKSWSWSDGSEPKESSSDWGAPVDNWGAPIDDEDASDDDWGIF